MAEKRDVDICEMFQDGTAIDEAIEEAGRQAVLHHQMTGVPLVYWQDGKVVHIDPFTGQVVDPPKDDLETKSKYRPVPYYLHAL